MYVNHHLLCIGFLLTTLSCALFATEHSMSVLKTHISEIKSSQNHYQLILYSNPHCPYCQKVLDYLKSQNKTLPIKNTQDPKVREELVKIGGKAQVPCLLINGQPLYESSQILQWLKNHSQDY